MKSDKHCTECGDKISKYRDAINEDTCRKCGVP